MVEPSGGVVVVLPVSRVLALTHAALWGVAAALPGVAAASVYAHLNFVPTGLSNRLVDYSIALLCLPLALLAVVCAWKVLQRLMLACWPAPIEVRATQATLTLRFGPCGTREYDTARLEVRYPFECSTEAEGGTFEAFLPKEQQLAGLVPRLLHPDASDPLNRTILRFVGGSEASVASALRVVVEVWRARAKSAGGPCGIVR